ncbi:universal stress protein [Halobaculum lipolyticum]|uniref:Universal stress protein n=1 Tax=Halobaculum lipolyticum TaxID=3032001 RepID=A0ABD5WCT4_9EURY|nr:universal stress protein [Halobaculum sp. DT31]
MSETMLVPIDGSVPAERALRYAVATFPTASITTLYVVDPVESVIASEAGGLSEAEAWYETERERGTEIHDAAAEIAAEYGVELTAVTEVGRPAPTILDYCEEHGIDQIVMGSHGRTGIERAVLGSVAERVVRRSRKTVTVVR